MRAVGSLVLVSILVCWAAPVFAGWDETIDRTVPSVVVLRVVAPRAFDGGAAGYSTATGFVVDAERGLILTNRHVVQPGPVRAQAVFLNNEEVDVTAVYRDPVHDFGLFRFSPDDVKFMEVRALELAPDRARVGREIRVIGNDAGEKISILAGTMARLDRPAPNYGASGYNDFNTFYYQAASATSGGSSGSPVIDESGRAIALNAGASVRAASSFYLPLDRVVRALDFIQKGEAVPRGTVQAVLNHAPYDQLRRLGLRPETEAAVRKAFPEQTGMIVVGEIVPGGPADGKLRPGDVVVRVENKLVTTFLPIEAALDDGVGGALNLSIERGGERIDVELKVQDLHSITPASFVEFGFGVLHTLSYHQARNNSVAIGGVYVASSGYSLWRSAVPMGSVITHVNNDAVADLAAFERKLAEVPHGERALIRYFPLSNPRSSQLAAVPMDRRWFPVRACRRDDATGRWPCREIAAPVGTSTLEPATARLEAEGSKALRVLASSMVIVDYNIPFRLDGVHGDRFRGNGLIVDADMGLVVVDRETVPIAIGDLQLTFGGSVKVPGELEYLHPEHNFAVIRYDPKLLGDTPVRSATLWPSELQVGDKVTLVASTARHRVVSRESRISRREALILPPVRIPRFRESNLELVTLADATSSVGGVLADSRGRVLALWASFLRGGAADDTAAFFAGIPIQRVIDVVEPLREGREVGWRSFGAELRPQSLADGRELGLSEAWAQRLENHDPSERRVLSVASIAAGSPAASVLREGDMLLSVEGEPVTRVHDVERATQAASVKLRLMRGGEEQVVALKTELLDGLGTRRALLWNGALLQEAPRSLATEFQLEQTGVYVAWVWFGSPANRYGLSGAHRIVAVDGKPTPDLDALVAATREVKDRASMRLEILDLGNKLKVITVERDLDFWPTEELRLEPNGWERSAVGASASS